MPERKQLFNPQALTEFTDFGQPVAPDENISEVQKGLIRGGKYLGAGIQEAGALAAGLVGAKDTQRSLEEGATQSLRNAQLYAPRVASLSEANTVKDYVDFFAGGVPESAAFLGSTLLGGVAGRRLGKALKLGKKGKNVATAAGAFTGVAVPETGFTSRDIREETGQRDPLLALAAGGAKGLLDVYSTGKNLQTFLPRKGIRSLLSEIYKSGVREGITEAAQEGIDIGAVQAAKGEFKPLGPEEFNRLIDSAALGAAGGVSVSAAGTATRAAVDRFFKAPDQASADDLSAAIEDSLGPDKANLFAQEAGYDSFEAMREAWNRGEFQGEEVAAGLDNVFFDQQEEIPWPTTRVWKEAGVANPKDRLGEQLDALNADDPIIQAGVQELRDSGATDEEIKSYIKSSSPYQRVSYYDTLKGKAQETGENLDLMMAEAAQKIVKRFPKLQQQLDKLGTKEFLKRTEHIQKAVVPGAIGNEFAFSNEELYGVGKDAKARHMTAILRKPGYDKKTKRPTPATRNGDVLLRIKRDGKWQDVSVNLHALVKAQRRRGTHDSSTTRAEQIAQMLSDGLSTIASMEGVEDIDFSGMTKLTNDQKHRLVVFNDFRPGQPSRAITLAEVEALGKKARAIARETANRIRLERAYEYMRGLESQARRLQQIAEKLAIEVDQDEISRLRKEYKRIRAGLPTLESDLENARREVARVQAEIQARTADDQVGFDPNDIEEATGKEDGAVESVPKQPIYRGYSSSDTPSAENLYNFGVKEELFEKAVSSEDIKTATEKWYEYYLSLKNLLEAVSQSTDQKYLDAVYRSLFKKTGVPPSGVKKELLLNTIRNRVRWANDKLVEIRKSERPQIWETLDDLRAQSAMHPDEIHPLPSDFITRDWTAEKEEIERIAKSWLEQMGLVGKVTFLTPAEAYKLAADNASANENDVTSGMFQGFAGMNKTLGSPYVIYINPLMSRRAKVRTLAHEIGHVVLLDRKTTDLFDSKGKPSPLGKKVFQEFENWIKKTEDPSTPIAKILKDRDIPVGIMKAAMRNEAIGSNYKQAFIEYMKIFDEWFADRVRNRLLDPAPPKNAVERFFEKIVEGLRKVFNLAEQPNLTVEDYVDTIMRKSASSGWRSPREPHQVLQAWLEKIGSQVTPNEAEELRFKTGTIEEISKFMEKVTGHKLTNFDRDFLVEIAHMQQHDAMGAALNKAIRYGMQKLLTPEEHATIARAASSPIVLRQLARLLKNHPEAWEEVKSDPDAAAAYAYQFWMSGQVNLGPRTTSLYQKIYDFFIDLLGIVTDAENAERIFDRFTAGDALLRAEGPVDESVSYIKRASRNTRIQRVAHDKLAPAWKRITRSKFGYSMFSAAGTRMRDTGNPYLQKIANMVFARVGSQFEGEDMLTAKTRMVGRFTNIVRHIFETENKEFSKAVIGILNEGREIDPGTKDPHEVAALKVRHLMDMMRDYFIEAGLEVPKTPNYFPWVFDLRYVSENREALEQLLSADNFKQFFNKESGPREVVSAIINSAGLADSEIRVDKFGHTPRMDAMNKRTLKFIDTHGTPEQRSEFAKYFSDDLGLTLITYIEQGVKRAEYNRRFGGNKLNKLIDKARTTGATDSDIELARTYMNAVLGTHGYETNKKLAEILGMEPPPPGEIVNPKLQRTMGILMVYQNLRVLSMATITSLADPVGIAVRTGSLGIAFDAFKSGIRAATKAEIFEASKGKWGEREMLIDLAEMIGVIDRHMTVEALNWEYGGTYITGWERKINEGFFKWIGLQSWTRMTRVMGLQGGLKFIRRHVTNPNQHSERFLAELDLQPQDVIFDESGEVKILSFKERESATPEERARDDRVRAALHRFVDGAILRPNAALRPIWASDPHFMLIFHLKSFMYAFHERILKRVILEAGNGNLAPLMMFALFIPAMIMSDALRDLIKYGTEGDPVKANWGVTDYMGRAIERSGMLGLTQIPVDVSQAVKYGGVGIEPFIGPTAEQVLDILTNDDYKFSKALPGQNLAREWTGRLTE